MQKSIINLGLFLVLWLSLAACQEQSKESEKSQVQNTENMTKPTRDAHSFARPEEALMQKLSLDLSVDFEQKILKGTASITYKKLKPEVTKLYLDTKKLQIEAVKLGGKSLKFTLDEEKPYLGQALIIDIAEAPEEGIVEISYQTSPEAAALQWLSPVQTAGKEQPFLFTQSQAILARSWIPCQDSPGIRFPYEASIRTPKALMAVMSAENPTQKNEEGVYKFNMPQPIPAYLLALTVGNLRFQDLGEGTGVYAEPSMLEKSAYEFADLPKMLRAAEELYGKYRWGRYDLLVLPPSFPFGGMENPRLTFATPTIIAGDRSLTSLVAHELAHSWSGNLVTNATWDDFWLNEGFTVYFERRIMESLYGADYADMLEFLGYQDLQHTLAELKKENPKDTHLKLNLAERDPDEGLTDVAYEKGYFFLRTIEENIGRAKMDTFLKQYFERHAFQTMQTEQFVKYLKKELPSVSSLNLQDWIYGEGLPDNCPEVKSTRFEQVKQAYEAWQSGEKSLKELDTKNWSSHEWLYFVRGLEQLNPDKMQALDQAFAFSQSGNSEILAAWLQKAIEQEYEAAYPALETFLVNVGRRKFLTPLYGALLKTEAGKERANAIYEKARPNYHFVSVATLDNMLGRE